MSEVTVPLKPKPKARPRVTAHSTFMPRAYSEWKQAAALIMRTKIKESFDGPVRIELVFRKDSFDVKLVASDNSRWGRADLDNLAGAVMDALQDSGVIENDKQVVELVAKFEA